MAIKDIKMTETCKNCMHTELIKKITSILALHKLGRYTMLEAFQNSMVRNGNGSAAGNIA